MTPPLVGVFQLNSWVKGKTLFASCLFQELWNFFSHQNHHENLVQIWKMSLHHKILMHLKYTLKINLFSKQNIFVILWLRIDVTLLILNSHHL